MARVRQIACLTAVSGRFVSCAGHPTGCLGAARLLWLNAAVSTTPLCDHTPATDAGHRHQQLSLPILMRIDSVVPTRQADVRLFT